MIDTIKIQENNIKKGKTFKIQEKKRVNLEKQRWSALPGVNRERCENLIVHFHVLLLWNIRITRRSQYVFIPYDEWIKSKTTKMICKVCTEKATIYQELKSRATKREIPALQNMTVETEIAGEIWKVSVTYGD